MYRLTIDENTVLDLSDMAFVPLGSDRWEAYQEWLSSGLKPEPMYTPEQLRINNAISLDEKLQAANREIARLQNRIEAIQDAIDGDYAIPSEQTEIEQKKSYLPAWKRYRVELGRVDLDNPIWPEMPIDKGESQ